MAGSKVGDIDGGLMKESAFGEDLTGEGVEGIVEFRRSVVGFESETLGSGVRIEVDSAGERLDIIDSIQFEREVGLEDTFGDGGSANVDCDGGVVECLGGAVTKRDSKFTLGA